MKITLLVVGKTDDKALERMTAEYSKRIGHYINFETIVLPDVKRSAKISEEKQKEEEAELILKQLTPRDKLYLFDERGKEYTSEGFASFLEEQMLQATHRLVIVIGGPYGFSDRVYDAATGLLSLSKMTFSHQMVRLFATEQIYRAMTILRGEPYHHK